MNSKLFFIGDWQVTPPSNIVRKGQVVKQLEPKAMDVLVLLCHQQGEVLSADEIINQCWGNTDIGDNPIHKAITQLRKALEDKASDPKYIETIRKRGYRVIANIDFPLSDTPTASKKEWQGGSPFPGLSAFEPKEAQVFFGRNAQIVSLLERLSTQISQGRAFCLLLGPSGTGKSSLVNAGLLPRLLFENGFDGIRVLSHTTLDLADVATNRLFIDLASTMLDWDVNGQVVFDNLSADTLAEMLRGNISEVLSLLTSFMQATNTDNSTNYLFIFIDRLEVILSSPIFDDFERQQFVGLIDLFSSTGHVIVISACRNDFYPLLAEHKTLMQGKENGAHFDLMPPNRTELMQMIRMPAEIAGLSWGLDEKSDIALDEILCDHAARHPDSLPMLQYTLQELYLQRSNQDDLQFSVYENLGGIEGAIGKQAEEVFVKLPQAQQAELPFLLSQLVTVNAEGDSASDNITSRAARWEQLQNQAQKDLVQAMVDSRLFVSHLKQEQACFSLAHESLLRRWPRAAKWIAEHQTSLVVKSRLLQLSEKWLKEHKSNAYLLQRGKPLFEAKALQANPIFVLSSQELSFIKASQKRYKNRQWLTRAVILTLCFLTITSAFMSIKSYETEALAQQKRIEAESLLGFMVGEFADKLRSVKRMDLLDGISNKALEYFSQQDQQQSSGLFGFVDAQQNFKASFQHAQTLSAMGEVARSRGKADEAQKAFESAKIILDKLFIKQPENMALLKYLGANAFWLGQLAMDNAEFTQAKTFFELYLEYSQTMVKLAPNDLDGQWELSYAYMGVGSVNIKLQQYQMAKSAFENALDLQYKLVEDLPNEDISHLYVADTLEWLAESDGQLGDLQRSVKTREKAQEIVEGLLATHKGSADLLENLAYSYFNTANLHYYLSEYSAANQAIIESIKYFKHMLIQDPSNEIWQLELLSAHAFENFTYKNIQNDISIPLIRISEFKKILDRVEKLDVAIIVIIKIYQLNGNWMLAQKAIDLAKPVLEELVSPQSGNSLLLSTLSRLYLTEAKQLEHYQIEKNSKLKVCEQAITSLQSSITLISSFETILPYVQAHDCLDKLDAVQNFVQRLEDMQIHNYRF